MTYNKIMNLQPFENYLRNNEVVYQIADELVNVANAENPECREEMLEMFTKCEALVTTDKALALNMGFEELVQWSTDDDTLICCDGEMLLCMPSKDFEKLTIQ